MLIEGILIIMLVLFIFLWMLKYVVCGGICKFCLYKWVWKDFGIWCILLEKIILCWIVNLWGLYIFESLLYVESFMIFCRVYWFK